MSDPAPRGRSRREFFRKLGRPVENAPRAVADAFVDAYYVRQDPGVALPLAGGAARGRLEGEAAAVKALPGGRSASPSVASTLEHERESPAGASYTYVLDVTPAGGAAFTRHVTLGVVLREGQHRVVTIVER